MEIKTCEEYVLNQLHLVNEENAKLREYLSNLETIIANATTLDEVKDFLLSNYLILRCVD